MAISSTAAVMRSRRECHAGRPIRSSGGASLSGATDVPLADSPRLLGREVEDLAGVWHEREPLALQVTMGGSFGRRDIAGAGRPVDVPPDAVVAGVGVGPGVWRAVAGEPDLGQRVILISQHV